MANFKGYTIEPANLHPILYPHQRDIVQWAVQGGTREYRENESASEVATDELLAMLARPNGGVP